MQGLKRDIPVPPFLPPEMEKLVKKAPTKADKLKKKKAADGDLTSEVLELRDQVLTLYRSNPSARAMAATMASLVTAGLLVAFWHSQSLVHKQHSDDNVVQSHVKCFFPIVILAHLIRCLVCVGRCLSRKGPTLLGGGVQPASSLFRIWLSA